MRAEVSNVARPRSGHIYLVLKDDGGFGACGALEVGSPAARLRPGRRPGRHGLGKSRGLRPRGEYQVSIREIEPEGIGALELAFRQTVARLAAEGLFDPERSERPLPRFPGRIVVVTSPSGRRSATCSK